MKEEVEIVFHSFELDPNAKKSYDESIYQLIAKKYGMSIEQAIAANNNIINAAKAVGLAFNFDKLQPTNTFDAHRLSHYAKDQGKLKAYTEAVVEKLFYGFIEHFRLWRVNGNCRRSGTRSGRSITNFRIISFYRRGQAR